MSRPAVGESSAPSRGALVRDLLIFLLKLWVDGLKDLALFPLSLGAAAADLNLRRSQVPRSPVHSTALGRPAARAPFRAGHSGIVHFHAGG